MARWVHNVLFPHAGLDGADGFSISSSDLDTGVGVNSTRQIRLGWLASPGFFEATDLKVVATVKAIAYTLSNAGCHVEKVRFAQEQTPEHFRMPLTTRSNGFPVQPDAIPRPLVRCGEQRLYAASAREKSPTKPPGSRFRRRRLSNPYRPSLPCHRRA
jgi:hypothetical protein